jgi:hypothetical protein
MENNLTWQEFERVSMRGHHHGSQRFSGGPKTSLLTIDFGETIGIRKLRHKLPNATLGYLNASYFVVNFPK